MARGPVYTERLVWDALDALEGGGVDAQAAQQVLADTAKALARALPVRDGQHDPDLDGHAISPEEIKAAAVDARFFLELVADLLGSSSDPDWTGNNFDFSGALKRRPGWKPPAKPTAAQLNRQAAAARVYELMAASFFDNGQPPKQEAAIASAMQEFHLARSKVMQGLKEYRESNSWLQSCIYDDYSESRFPPVQEQMARIHQMILRQAHQMISRQAMAREWFRRNPDAHFLYAPAGSDLEKELLSRESPFDPQ